MSGPFIPKKDSVSIPSQETALSQPARGRGKAKGTQRSHWFWITVVLCVASGLGLYFWVTSARILKVPIEISFGPTSPIFTSATGPLLGADFTKGNSAKILVNGAEFFPAMLDDIARAQKTITLETYIWASGEISDKFIAALSERARQGVKVKVLVDGMGTLKLKSEDWDTLRKAGVEILKYGRQHWYEIKPNINHRTHRKILVIDGKVGYTGGMCIDDKWQGDADSKETWRETQVRIEGPAVRQMQAVFAMNWLQTTSSLLLGEDYFPVIKSVGDVVAQCYMSGPGESPETARVSHILAIAAARKSIDISNAYFVPDDLAVESLLAAAARGVKIRVVIPAINDSRFGRAVARSRWGKLLAAGVEFYQFMPAMYHCKVMVVDDFFVTIGSINFDNRSFAINDEVALNILDRGVAQAQHKVFMDDIAQSTPLTNEEFLARPFYIKTADYVCGLFRSQF